MTYTTQTLAEHFARDTGPKRILSLDGGGMRGILTLQFLRRVEGILRRRHGNGKAFRLGHYFDLIAGTSTGAIIAAGLAKGMTVAQIEEKYLDLTNTIFDAGWFRWGVARAKYDASKVEGALKEVLGAETSLGSDKLITGLLVVTKRLDTGSQWPLSNNPHGRYYHGSENSVPNKDYLLWQVVRASTAAPTYFRPETIAIAADQKGHFIDGGVSTANNPSLEAIKLALLEGFHLRWHTGADRLLVISAGTGRADPAVTSSKLAAKEGLRATVAVMDDCGELVETMMQWMGTSRTGRVIDRELGRLNNDTLGSESLFTYQRYNVTLEEDWIRNNLGGMKVPAENMATLEQMDQPDNVEILKKLGERAAKLFVESGDFPSAFDLR